MAKKNQKQKEGHEENRIGCKAKMTESWGGNMLSCTGAY